MAAQRQEQILKEQKVRVSWILQGYVSSSKIEHLLACRLRLNSFALSDAG